MASEKEAEIFPSLQDEELERLGVLATSNPNNNNDSINNNTNINDHSNGMTDKEIESKFTALALAFRTDRLTLEQRLQRQRRQRELAESNMAAECARLREAHERLALSPTDVERERFRWLLDALDDASKRVSGAAEMYGAVQQEARLSSAMEVIGMYVENLKRLRELESKKQALVEDDIPEPARSVRNPRRASIAALPRGTGPGPRVLRPLDGRLARWTTPASLDKDLGQSGGQPSAQAAAQPNGQPPGQQAAEPTANTPHRQPTGQPTGQPSGQSGQPPTPSEQLAQQLAQGLARPTNDQPPESARGAWSRGPRASRASISCMSGIEELSESRRESAADASSGSVDADDDDDDGGDEADEVDSAVIETNFQRSMFPPAFSPKPVQKLSVRLSDFACHKLRPALKLCGLITAVFAVLAILLGR